MANPKIGPYDVQFNINASIADGGNGVVSLTTGTDTQKGAEFRFNPEGTVSTPGGDLATEQYVLDAVSSSAPADAVTQSALDNALSNYVKSSGLAAAIKNIIDPPWIVPTLQNGWGPYAGSTAMPVGYRKVGGMVQLRGLIGGGAQGSTMWVMPAGYRPKADGAVRQAVMAAGGSLKYTNVLVESTGVVKYNATDAANLLYVSLAGLSYPCED